MVRLQQATNKRFRKNTSFQSQFHYCSITTDWENMYFLRLGYKSLNSTMVRLQLYLLEEMKIKDFMSVSIPLWFDYNNATKH